MSFTGDIRFKTLLAGVLEKNELNGKSAYALYFATKNSNSGWSFGIPQYDLSTRNPKTIDLFKIILTNAKSADGNYIIDDGDPTTDRDNDKTVADLIRKAMIKGGTSLSTAEKNIINQALSVIRGT